MKDRVADFLIRANERPPTSGGKPGLFCVLLGLDGSGKTSVARALLKDASGASAFRKIRYLHWIPKPWTPATFPLPSFGNIPRRAAEKRTLVSALLSTVRLLKNLFWARLAFAFRLKPWISGGALVLVDRYYYNYWIDPASVRYTGPEWLLKIVEPLFPRPDLVLVLWAGEDVLLQRKQELSREEMTRQLKLLSALAERPSSVTIDATQSLPEVVECAMKAIDHATRESARSR